MTLTLQAGGTSWDVRLVGLKPRCPEVLVNLSDHTITCTVDACCGDLVKAVRAFIEPGHDAPQSEPQTRQRFSGDDLR